MRAPTLNGSEPGYTFTVRDIGDGDSRIELVKHATPPCEPAPIYWISLASIEQVNTVCAWLARHRKSWCDWGRLVESTDANTLCRVLVDLWIEDPPVVPDEMCFVELPDPHEIWVGVQMRDGSRRALVVHRFASPLDRDALLEWVDLAQFGTDREGLVRALAVPAWLQGSDVLRPLLDELSAVMSDPGQPDEHPPN